MANPIKETKYSLTVDKQNYDGGLKVTGKVKYTISEYDKKVVVRVTGVETKADGPTGKDDPKTYSVSHALTVNGESFWSRSASYNRNQQYTEGQSTAKAFDKGELDQNLHFRYVVTVGPRSHSATSDVKLKRLAAEYLKPKWKVQGLTLERSGNTFKAKWKVQSAATNTKNVNRYSGIEARFSIETAGKNPPAYDKKYVASATEASATYSNFGSGFGRNKLHPAKEGVTASLVKVRVRGYHKVSETGKDPKYYYGDWADAVYKFAKPRAPEVSFEYDENKRSVTATVKSDPGEDSREWYGTYGLVNILVNGDPVSTAALSTRKTEWSHEYDLSKHLKNVADGITAGVRVQAAAAGVGGTSSTVSKTRTVCRPGIPTVGKITKSGKGQTARITVAVKPGKYTSQVQLERRHGSGPDSTEEQVSNAVDNGNAKSLYDTVADAQPVAGEHLYYRVHASRDGYDVYSAWKRADALYTAEAKPQCNATGKLSVAPSANGQGATVTMKWADSTNNHGTELSWSDSKDAWKTTAGPETEEYAYGGKSDTKKATITGLSMGKTYYLKMRRYRNVGDSKVYSKYLASMAFTTTSADDDTCVIKSVEPSKDGTSAVVVAAFKEDNRNTGTEFSFSTRSGAWSNSTDGPSVVLVERSDKNPAYKGYTGTKTFTLTDLAPGETYYVKARRYLESDNETSYSKYSKAVSFTTESAKDDRSFMVSATSSADGTSARVVVGFVEDATNTGTVIEWSDNKNVWNTSEDPSSANIAGKDSKKAVNYATVKKNGVDQRVTLTGTHSFTVLGLTPGTRYYFRARRYMESGSATTYSPYSKQLGMTTAVPSPETARDDRCFIVSVKPSKTTAKVIAAFKEDSTNTGTEFAWSTRNKWWNSTEGEDSQQFPGKDGTQAVSKVTVKNSGGKATTYTVNGTKTVTLTDLEPGKTYYVRARRYLESGGETTYAPWSTVKSFVTESAKDDKCYIDSVSPDKTGTTCALVIGFTEDATNTGTELAWSTRKNAFSTDEQPETQTWTGKDGTPAASGYTGTKTVTLTGLTQGTTYFVWARRYLEANGSTTYTKWSARESFVTESAEDDTCGIIGTEPHADGEGCTVMVGYTEDNANTGTELQWSDYGQAWTSNLEPSKLLAAWGGKAYSGNAWAKYQTIELRGLTPGSKYFLKARRYLEVGGTMTYTKWSPLRSFSTPIETAANDRVRILSATLDPDGDGARLVLGINEDNDNTGTEITWSTDVHAWESNEQPNSLMATWLDARTQDTDYGSTQSVYLRGLELGTTYFVRARRYNGEGGEATYSPYSQTFSVKTPNVKNDPSARCGIVSLDMVDGETAILVVGHDGDFSGTEATWSTNPNAWTSSEQPESMTFEWTDASNKSAFKTADTAVDATKTYYTRSGSGTDARPYKYTKVASPTTAGLASYYELGWSGTATIYLGGLTEGETYYVRARTWFDGEEQVWSDYTEAATVTCVTAPSSVSLAGPDAIARGESIELYWTVEHDLDQTEWHVHQATWDATGERWVVNNGKALESGTGSLAHASIPASRYGDAGSIALYVSAGCGGGLTDSNIIAIGIADVPSCEASVGATATAKPVAFYAYTDDPTSRMLATCRSLGVTFQAPDGDHDQIAGDVVWTAAIEPAWVESTWGQTQLRQQLSEAVTAAQDAYDEASQGDDETATANALTALTDAQAALAAHPAGGGCYMTAFEVPDGAELMDGGAYEITVAAVERIAGLSSAPATCRFAVEWLHQAPAPSDEIAVEPDIDARSVRVTLAQPDGWAQGDAYELYRMTPTGHVLVADSLAADDVVDDPYAPFGATDLHYRIAVRTADGDVAYEDYAYDMDVRALRFDWGTDFVEVPFNIEISDAYEKSFEARSHVDGSVNGYYDRAVTHTGSYTADIVKTDAETIAALRRLGEHPGAVFCRTGRGDAFQCNADLGNLDLSYSTMVAGASFPITEMKLTAQFMARKQEEEG